jgi:hypothetical protein
LEIGTFESTYKLIDTKPDMKISGFVVLKSICSTLKLVRIYDSGLKYQRICNPRKEFKTLDIVRNCKSELTGRFRPEDTPISFI